MFDDPLPPHYTCARLRVATTQNAASYPNSAEQFIARRPRAGGISPGAGTRGWRGCLHRPPPQVAPLTASLQSLAARSSTPVQPGTQATPFIPLFVAMEQDGGGPAYSQITSGLTPQPSPMAIGATWNPDIAKEMGRIVGSELSAIGVNFLRSEEHTS